MSSVVLACLCKCEQDGTYSNKNNKRTPTFDAKCLDASTYPHKKPFFTNECKRVHLHAMRRFEPVAIKDRMEGLGKEVEKAGWPDVLLFQVSTQCIFPLTVCHSFTYYISFLFFSHSIHMALHTHTHTHTHTHNTHTHTYKHTHIQTHARTNTTTPHTHTHSHTLTHTNTNTRSTNIYTHTHTHM